MRLHVSKRAMALITLALVASAGLAQGFPTKPIRILVGFSTGTATDTITRQVAQAVTKNRGWTIIVENKPGQAGSVAARELIRADPDGHTLLVTANGPLLINPNLYKNVTYRAEQDFTPISQLAALRYVLVVNKESPYGSVNDLIDRAKKSSKNLNYSSPGAGTTAHLMGATFARIAGIELTHVPYRGSSESIAGLIEGSIDLTFDTTVATTAPIQAGKLRPLAVLAPQRLPHLPDVPTLTEKGVPVDLEAWIGVVAPKGLPDAVVQTLSKEFQQAVMSAEMQTSLSVLGATAHGQSSADFARFIRDEQRKWTQAVENSGLRPE